MKKEDLDKIYPKIPAMICKHGCTDCCGPVPWSKSEWDAIGDKRVATDINCPYSISGCCDVYSQRPLICRLFGVVDDPLLACPHGLGPLLGKMSRSEASAIIKEYHAKIDD